MEHANGYENKDYRSALGDFVHHPPGDISDVKSPEEWEQEDWDSQRQPPKTLREAKAALHGRIADPDAPDTDEHADVYDGLEENHGR